MNIFAIAAIVTGGMCFVGCSQLDRQLVQSSGGTAIAESTQQAAAQSVKVAEKTVQTVAFEDAQLPLESLGEGEAYTLDQVEQMALANNSAIASAAANASKAAGLRYQVGLKPNPTLGYFGQQIADRGTDQHGAFVEQEFVRGNKLELNRAVLRQTTEAQRWENETQRYRVLTDVRVRFYEALAAQQQVDAINEFAQVAGRGVEIAQKRVEAEEGTVIETLQAETLLSETNLASRQAAVSYRGAWQDLAAIAGMDSTTPVRLMADWDAPPVTQEWDAAYAEIISQSPELAVARALICEKRALLSRQQVQAIPNVTAQLAAGYDDGTDHGLISLQVGIPIPVNNRNTGNVSAAYADYVQATHNLKRIENAIQSRLARASQEYDSALAAVMTYQEEIIPQAERSLQLSEDAYRVGELDFLQVLIVRRTYYESTIRQIVAKGQLAQAAARIDGLLLTGGLDAPTDYTDGDGIRSASFGGQ